MEEIMKQHGNRRYISLFHGTEKWWSQWLLLSSAALIMLAASASSCEAIYKLPLPRSVTWRGNVGVTSDIPSRNTVFRSLRPSGGNDTAAIQAALNSCPTGQVVFLSHGTFSITRPISVKSGVTLRGAGMGTTIIKGAPGMTGGYLVGIYNTGFFEGAPIGITAGLAKGSLTITTTAPHGWSEGDLIVIDQLNDPSGTPPVTNVGVGTSSWDGRTGNRSLGQVSRIKAVTATTATLEIPLYWNYDGRLAPMATKLHQITRDAGVEELTIDNSLSGSANQVDNGGTVVMRGTTNCWLLRVEVIGSWQSSVRVNAAYRNTMRSCKLHEGVPARPATGPQYGTSRAYGFFINPYASANLFENNEIYHLVSPFLIAGAISGNVIAYNYMPDPYYTDGNWIQVTIGFHGPHPMMNLIEGNYSVGRIAPDNYWGSSSHNTFFRNRNMLPAGKTGAPWNLDLQYHAQFYNVVGNVIGSPGAENAYELHDKDLAGQRAVYRFGYTSDGDGTAAGNDPQVYATVLRHGNWDSVHKSILWNGSDDRRLPASLYLTNKPKWWGSTRWPAIGPDLSPMYPADPGAGNGTPWTPSAIPPGSRNRGKAL
jgi:hypothetical protein